VIPFLDLQAQHRGIRAELDRAVAQVLESSQFILGREVAAFEEEFAAYCRVRFAIGVNSGTSALHLALLALGIGPGNEVITVPFTFVATVATIRYTGAQPVFADIDPATFSISPQAIENAITPRTKAIVPVHLYGHPADIDPILEIARRHHLAVIEDAAQAHGAEYKGHRVGSLGDLGCFSFYPTKNLGACGEAGMVVTNDEALAAHVRKLRSWGQSSRYHHDFLGFNYRMEALQGAILRVKLRHLDAWTEARRAHAAAYNRLLAPAGVQLPAEAPYARHVYHAYTIRLADRDPLAQTLAAAGIGTAVHYPLPIHLQPGYRDPRYQPGDFPHS
jgi:dTDP-4-amino-4,6-dideoxygalactose transaminase